MPFGRPTLSTYRPPRGWPPSGCIWCFQLLSISNVIFKYGLPDRSSHRCHLIPWCHLVLRSPSLNKAFITTILEIKKYPPELGFVSQTLYQNKKRTSFFKSTRENKQIGLFCKIILSIIRL
jgi:hypothetical protein